MTAEQLLDAVDLDALSAEDGFDEENGLDCCPICETVFSPNGGYTGAVYGLDGRRYETILDSDPADRPFACGDCWPAVEAAQKAAANQSLANFTGEEP